MPMPHMVPAQMPALAVPLQDLGREWSSLLVETRHAVNQQLMKQDLLFQQLLCRVGELEAMAGLKADQAKSERADDDDGKWTPGSTVVPAAQEGAAVVQAPGRSGSHLGKEDVSGEESWVFDQAASDQAAPQEDKKVVRSVNKRHSKMLSGHGGRSSSSSNTASEAVNRLSERSHFAAALFRRLIVFLDWFNELQEPPRKGWLAQYTLSKKFETLSGMVILSNVIFTIFSANRVIDCIIEDEKCETKAIELIEGIYFAFFLSEIVLKMVVHRLFFFANEDMGWNILDLLIVGISSANMFATYALESDTVQVTFLRSFRLLKITRVLRMLRVIKACRELRMMLDAVLSSCRSLVWVFFLLATLFGVFSLLFVQLITDYVEKHKDEVHCEYSACTAAKLVEFFGTVERGMLSLLMGTTGGINWINLWQLLDDTGSFNGHAFIFFIFVFYFCIYNLLTGLFVDQAVKAAQPEKEHIIFDQRNKESKQLEELKRLIVAHDMDGDGRISYEEFLKMLDDDGVCLWLAAFGLDISDAKLFFNMLLDYSKEDTIPMDLFVQGCMRMKGDATSIDMQALTFQMRNFMNQQLEVQNQVKLALSQVIPAPRL